MDRMELFGYAVDLMFFALGAYGGWILTNMVLDWIDGGPIDSGE